MKRDYRIINLHMSWGLESDNSTGHAIVLGRLAVTSNKVNEQIPPYTTYDHYKSDCKLQGIYSANEDTFNKYFNPNV